MKTVSRKYLYVSLLFMSLLSLVFVPLVNPYTIAAEKHEEISDALAVIKGKPLEERQALYEQIIFDTAGWEKGMVLVKDPLAIVYDVLTDPDGTQMNVRVWTGILARVEDDLLTYWDEIMIDGESGEPLLVVPSIHKAIPGYFAAKHQHLFRTDQYLGNYPWVNIPTDQEAAIKDLKPVSDRGMIDLYENDFGEEDIDIIAPGSVDVLTQIPSKVSELFSFTEITIDSIPNDIADHWAKDNIIDLMQKGIVEGYPDGTIRPELTLSRGEFIALLSRTLQLSDEAGIHHGYSDIESYWGLPEIKTIIASGIVPVGNEGQKLHPDGKVPRIEMAQMIAETLALLGYESHDGNLHFTDIGNLEEEQWQALIDVTERGIINGYKEKDDTFTFRPDGTLTRAEAFVVVSRLISVE